MTKNEEILENIELYQKSCIFHPLTCGNNSQHSLLEGKIVDGKVILVCPDCDYTQENFGIPKTEVLKQILEESPLHKMLAERNKYDN